MTIGTKPLAPTTACNATSGPFAQIRSIGSRDKSSARVIHPTIVDGEILAFIKTQRLQFSQEGLVLRSRGGGITAGTKNYRCAKPCPAAEHAPRTATPQQSYQR